MGNKEIDYKRPEDGNERIDVDDVIENDCYEEVDLKKINKIKNIERKWNENSIIYSANAFNDLKDEIENINKVDEPKKDNPEVIEDKNDNEEKKDELNNIDNNNNTNNNSNNDNNNNNNDNNNNNNGNINNDNNNNDNNNNNNNDNNNLDNGQKIIIEVQNENLENEQNNNQNDALTAQAQISEQNNVDQNEGETALNIQIPNNINTNNDNSNIAGNDSRKIKNGQFNIKNIIPEYRLTHLRNKEIIYCGTLEKIFKIAGNNAITYSKRFCIFTKKYFSYYKSKEIYISLNKPILQIENKYILRIEHTSLNNGNYYFGIICEVNEITKDLIAKANSFVTNEGNTNELLLGFKTQDYKTMMKWVTVLKYFISQQNNQS